MKRIEWIDSLRGWSMLAVILGHIVGQLPFDNISSTIGLEITRILGPVRLGLMFFVSGLFVEKGLKRAASINQFFIGKTYSILWPFIVWTAIYCSSKLIFASRVNHISDPVSLLLSALTGGQSTIWFLLFLFIFFLLIPSLRKIPIYIIIPICIILASLSPSIPDNSIFSSGIHNDRLAKFFYMIPFFYLGDYLIRTLKDGRNILNTTLQIRYLSMGILSFILLSWLNKVGFESVFDNYWWKIPLALLSVPFFIVITAYVKPKFVLFIGANSIVFYVLHQLIIQFIKKFIPETNFLFETEVGIYIIISIVLLISWGVIKLRRFTTVDLLFTLKNIKLSSILRVQNT